ncbi:hypothetical protein GmHk_08G022992 [Glycine max]|nr:hypothetical protein GmHk_08G022992 [Glycine max]
MYNNIITYIGLHYSAHWQMVVILPKENVVIWFCSLHNKPNNYLKGIINSALKGLEILNKVNPSLLLGGLLLKQKGNTECGYYNNWEMYFTDSRPLEPERLKALRNQWAKYYLKVKNETYDV